MNLDPDPLYEEQIRWFLTLSLSSLFRFLNTVINTEQLLDNLIIYSDAVEMYEVPVPKQIHVVSHSFLDPELLFSIAEFRDPRSWSRTSCLLLAPGLAVRLDRTTEHTVQWGARTTQQQGRFHHQFKSCQIYLICRIFPFLVFTAPTFESSSNVIPFFSIYQIYYVIGSTVSWPDSVPVPFFLINYLFLHPMKFGVI